MVCAARRHDALRGGGDPPDALYFVVSGSLGAYATSTEGHRRLVGRITAGETVGEMALISGKPRNATVIALRDTELGRLPREAFERLMLSHPQGLLRIAQLMAQRLDCVATPGRAGGGPFRKTFAVVPNDARRARDDICRAAGRRIWSTSGKTELVWSQRGADHTSQWFHADRARERVRRLCVRSDAEQLEQVVPAAGGCRAAAARRPKRRRSTGR